MRRPVLSLAALATFLLGSGTAFAGPTCTNAPKESWLPEAAMKQKIAEMGYNNIRAFKTTSGNCYEIYGFDQAGRRAEVYFHPVTGAIVEAK